MSLERPAAPHTRRALLTAAAGAAAALTADAFARVAPAQAGTGAMQYGTTNDAGTSETSLASSSSDTTLGLVNSGSGGNGIEVTATQGFTGMWAMNTPAYPGNSAGLWAINKDAEGGAGVVGSIEGGSGVFGYAGPTPDYYAMLTTTMPMTGVYGYAPAGTGVHARSDAGTALRVQGKAVFSRSGRVRIRAGRSTKTVSLAGVASGSLVFAVLHSKRSGVYVSSVVPGSGAFTINLNKAPSKDTYVAYFVLN